MYTQALNTADADISPVEDATRAAQFLARIDADERIEPNDWMPAALLPAGWPGRGARRLCGEIYRGLLPASEKWLDRNGLNEKGPLPAPGAELARRFRD